MVLRTALGLEEWGVHDMNVVVWDILREVSGRGYLLSALCEPLYRRLPILVLLLHRYEAWRHKQSGIGLGCPRNTPGPQRGSGVFLWVAVFVLVRACDASLSLA